MSQLAAPKIISMLMTFCVFGLNAAAQTASPVIGSCLIRQAQGVKPETPPASGALSGIKLLVTGTDGTPLQRQRFYLLQHNVQEQDDLDWKDAPRREDLFAGASPQLREWLRRYNCDTLYCPEYEAEYASAVQNVPEFKKAYEDGLRKYKSSLIALRWITVNFPLKQARTAYYEKKKAWLARVSQKGGQSLSIMTDEKGIAYFTNVPLADYYISNLLPQAESELFWNCKVSVPPPIPRQLYSVFVELSAPKTSAPVSAAR